MSLSMSKCCYSNKCLQFFKCAVPLLIPVALTLHEITRLDLLLFQFLFISAMLEVYKKNVYLIAIAGNLLTVGLTSSLVALLTS